MGCSILIPRSRTPGPGVWVWDGVGCKFYQDGRSPVWRAGISPLDPAEDAAQAAGMWERGTATRMDMSVKSARACTPVCGRRSSGGRSIVVGSGWPSSPRRSGGWGCGGCDAGCRRGNARSLCTLHECARNTNEHALWYHEVRTRYDAKKDSTCCVPWCWIFVVEELEF